ncbi:ArgE/DapE family deacylase [Tautonia plasticadhaerens]|uniref:N-formyl-4-amino-5-aminomethyl-2-methylpyrimidine deformylase n=1 Tax=Tautonia plasticadhaerens TaxID=2527974 RepID=A0A518H6W6_9BACT|nr:ArgE/DapE family deacylase [Tautonia plasticadhaerens]QDV36585.1 N-formyl-4-amino-5-aminomethyl-2-methylpyrimidine deformylase [Tautonia plasticadhaerens]
MDAISTREADALAGIDLPRLVRFLADFVRIPSITGSVDEVRAQRLVADELAGLGLGVDLWPIDLDALKADPEFPGLEAPRSEAWGLVGSLPGEDGPTLILNGHVDVVPPGDPGQWTVGDPFSGRVEGGKVFGRGTCDMKGGLACALFALRTVREAGITLRGSVQVQSVVGEEDGGLGTFATLRRGHRGDAAIIPEPTSLAIVPANAGALTFRLTVPGRSAHASMRKSGVSAIDAFWPIWRALSDLEARINADPDPLMARFDPPYPLSLGVFRAGDWPSSVPDRLVAEGRLGVALGQSPEQARRMFESAIADACEADPWLRDHPVVIDWFGGQFAAGRTDPAEPIVGLVRSAHRDLLGSPPDLHGAPYGSDLRHLVNLGGIPTLQYGPGDIRLAHAPDEHVEVDALLKATRTLTLVILRFCGVR